MDELTLLGRSERTRVTRNSGPLLSDVTRNGKGATHVFSISFEGERGTVMMGGWSRQMPAACPPLSQRSTPPPPR
jgi:hypothetical protein